MKIKYVSLATLLVLAGPANAQQWRYYEQVQFLAQGAKAVQTLTKTQEGRCSLSLYIAKHHQGDEQIQNLFTSFSELAHRYGHMDDFANRPDVKDIITRKNNRLTELDAAIPTALANIFITTDDPTTVVTQPTTPTGLKVTVSEKDLKPLQSFECGTIIGEYDHRNMSQAENIYKFSEALQKAGNNPKRLKSVLAFSYRNYPRHGGYITDVGFAVTRKNR